MAERNWDVGITDAPDLLARWCRRQRLDVPDVVVDTTTGPPRPAPPAARSGTRTSAIALLRSLSDAESMCDAVEHLRHVDRIRLVVFRGLARRVQIDNLLSLLAEQGRAPTAVRRAQAGALHGVDIDLAPHQDALSAAATLLRIADLTAEWAAPSLARPRIAAHGTIGSWGDGLSWCSSVDPLWADDPATLNQAAPDVIALRGEAPDEIRRAIVAARSSGVPVVAFEPPGSWVGIADHHEVGLDPLPVGATRGESLAVRRPDAADPVADAALVSAAVGAPEVLTDGFDRLRPLLGGRLTELLASGAHLHDRVSTALWAARARRAALLEHGLAARWRQVAGAVAGRGLPITVTPPQRVTILIVADDPREAERLLAMARMQSHSNVETVGVTSANAAGLGADLVVVQHDGESLAAALERATREVTGELLTLFRDGWYGPHYVTDLVLAHREHAATMLSKAPSFSYAPADHQMSFSEKMFTLAEAITAGGFLVERDAVLATGWPAGTGDPLEHLSKQLRVAGASAHIDHPFGRVLEADGRHAPDAGAPGATTWTGLRLDVADADFWQ